MTDPHYDGGHRWNMEQEYYKGVDDGSLANRTDKRYEQNVHPYMAGWNSGYVNSGMQTLEVMKALDEQRRGWFKDLKFP